MQLLCVRLRCVLVSSECPVDVREVRAQRAMCSEHGDSDSAVFALPGAPSPAHVGLPVPSGASQGMEQCPVAPEQRTVVPEDIRRWWESTPALVRADPDVMEGFWTAPVEVQCCPVFVQKSMKVGWTLNEVQ